MTARELLIQAAKRHGEGKFAESESLCRQALAVDPNLAPAVHLLGVLAIQAGRLPDAIRVLTRAIELDPTSADCRLNLGMALVALGRKDEAIAQYQAAIQIKPNMAKAHSDLGMTLAALGHRDDALAAYQRARAVDPTFADAPYNLGNIHFEMGHADQAIAAYSAAIALRPQWAEAHHNLARAWKLKNEPAKAMDSLRRALVLKRDFPEAWNCMGEILADLREYEQAAAACGEALKLNNKHPLAHNNLGVSLSGLGKYDQAIEHFKIAISLSEKTAAFDPIFNLAWAHQAKGELDQAVTTYAAAASLRTDDPAVKWNLGIIDLLRGDYGRGWEGYERRLDMPEMQRVLPPFRQPIWDGSEATGKRIILCGEQGFGDVLQFARYVPMVAQRCDRVTLACNSGLLPLLRIQNWPVECLETMEAARQTFDLRGPLASLPRIFQTRLDNIPNTVPYLRADPARAAAWEERIGKAAEGRRRVGLVWEGKRRPDPFRSARLEELLPLSRVNGVWFCSLQKLEGDAPLSPPPGLEISDWTAELNDFAETAALIDGLDLVITIDTSVAHLAGAMGKPTWVLLRHTPDWRWMLDRSDSPWYPTMRLFRQTQLGDWKPPIEQAANALASL